MHRKLFTMILAALFACICMAVPVSAASVDTGFAGDHLMSVMSYYANSQLTVNGNSAVCTSTGKGAANTTTKITVLQVLEKRSPSGAWYGVASWYKIANSYQIAVVNMASDLSSGTYRLNTTFTFYSNTASEPVVKYSVSKNI